MVRIEDKNRYKLLEIAYRRGEIDILRDEHSFYYVQ